MIKHPDLFDDCSNPTARHTDPDTSHQAAMQASLSANTDRRAVLLLLFSVPSGLTDFDIASRLERQQTSVGKRRGELRDAGYVEATPDRRPAPSGSLAIVWRITSKGTDAAREIIAISQALDV